VTFICFCLDDDLRSRVVAMNYTVSRYPHEIGRYLMLKHSKDTPNVDRFKLLKNSKQRIDKDGLTTLKYKIIQLQKRRLYTKIEVDYDKQYFIPPINTTTTTKSKNKTEKPKAKTVVTKQILKTTKKS
jgi:hypothetical protein